MMDDFSRADRTLGLTRIRRFHRGVSFALLFLAVVILLAETFRYPEPHDRAALIAFVIPLAFAQLELWPSLAQRQQLPNVR
jgi:hypothetical protein